MGSPNLQAAWDNLTRAYQEFGSALQQEATWQASRVTANDQPSEKREIWSPIASDAPPPRHRTRTPRDEEDIAAEEPQGENRPRTATREEIHTHKRLRYQAQLTAEAIRKGLDPADSAAIQDDEGN